MCLDLSCVNLVGWPQLSQEPGKGSVLKVECNLEAVMQPHPWSPSRTFSLLLHTLLSKVIFIPNVSLQALASSSSAIGMYFSSCRVLVDVPPKEHWPWPFVLEQVSWDGCDWHEASCPYTSLAQPSPSSTYLRSHTSKGLKSQECLTMFMHVVVTIGSLTS